MQQSIPQLTIHEESTNLAQQLGPQWSAFTSRAPDNVAVLCDLGDGYQVLVTVTAHDVCTCVRQEVPQEFKSGKIKVREYLTPFSPILYRPSREEEVVVAVRKALEIQLGYADRACVALRKAVEQVPKR